MNENRKILIIDAGIFNGSNLDNQKSAWFKSPGYSARIQYLPIKGLAFVPSIQHQQIAERKSSYTSFDFGAYYESKGWHLEAEYLHKKYSHDAFDYCNAINAMVIYRQKLKSERSLVEIKDRITLQQLEKLYGQLAGLTIEERIREFDLRPDRADVIVPAAQIFLAIARSTGASEIVVPTIGLADGIINELNAKLQKEASR